MPCSPDTLLRLIRESSSLPVQGPRVLGVDDWAMRKGQTYGTLLLDLEQRRPIDLLPDREAAPFAAWLQAHPGVEWISRDRGEMYVQGARLGAPQAQNIADRWHLLRNVHDAFQRLLERHERVLQQVSREVDHLPEPTPPPLGAPSRRVVKARPAPARKSKPLSIQRERHLAMYRAAARTGGTRLVGADHCAASADPAQDRAQVQGDGPVCGSTTLLHPFGCRSLPRLSRASLGRRLYRLSPALAGIAKPRLYGKLASACGSSLAAGKCQPSHKLLRRPHRSCLAHPCVPRDGLPGCSCTTRKTNRLQTTPIAKRSIGPVQRLNRGPSWPLALACWSANGRPLSWMPGSNTPPPTAHENCVGLP